MCGPFDAPTALEFAPALTGVHDFSIDPTGTRGMVYANLGSPPTTAWPGPHAIKLSNGTWVQDPARDRPVLNSLDGGHLVFDGNVIGWDDTSHSGGATLREYTFSGTAWGQDAHLIEQVQTVSPHAGNIISNPEGTLRTLVELRVAEVAPFINDLYVYQRNPVQDWMLTGETDALRTAKPRINASGGVMTMDHAKLVYTANVGAETANNELVYRIFASQRTSGDSFEPGVELVIDGVDPNVGFSEPWINEDCTTLYYRSGDTTWMTTMVPP